MTEVRHSFCRICPNCCPIDVEIEAGKAVRVGGDKKNLLFDGFSCVKGRAQPDFLYSPDRLLAPQKRNSDGSFAPIGSRQALDEIADKLAAILAEDGPRAVATYMGTQLYTAAMHAVPVLEGFNDAIGSPMRFNSNTIDQPGKITAKALHGVWLAPLHTPDDAEVMLVIGNNPLISMIGLPTGSPGRWLTEAMGRGVELIVVDPRRTEMAHRATLHLQTRPGCDIQILAAMLHVIISERLYDHEFVATHTIGLIELGASVEPFSPDRVARLAGLEEADIVRAARMFAGRRGGFVFAGTGPNMAQFGTLLEYLVLGIGAVCGYRARAGDQVTCPMSLFPGIPAIEQAMAPFPPAAGEPLRVRDLMETQAGMPASALADEILLEGNGQVRALLVFGGNPVAAWPDQLKTIAAMEQVELLVVVDPYMSQTAYYADYVIPPRLALEKPGTTQAVDLMSVFYPVGPRNGHAQHTPAILEPPAGSDLVDEWEFCYGLAQRLGLELAVPHMLRMLEPVPLDMTTPPTDEELLDIVCAGSRIPLAQVRGHEHGIATPEPAITVLPGDPANLGRLDLANPAMMDDLARLVPAPDGPTAPPEQFLLTSRREMHVINSTYNSMKARGKRPYNPAYMNPADIGRLALAPGDLIDIRSARAEAIGIVAPDPTVRVGVVSMSHAFGGHDRTGDPRTVGTSTAVLSDVERDYDRYTGQPRMSAIPVHVCAHTALDGAAVSSD